MTRLNHWVMVFFYNLFLFINLFVSLRFLVVTPTEEGAFLNLKFSIVLILILVGFGLIGLLIRRYIFSFSNDEIKRTKIRNIIIVTTPLTSLLCMIAFIY